MTAPLDEKAEHPRIWLEPAGAPDRCWCSENQWGDEGVQYILASEAFSAVALPDELEGLLLNLEDEASFFDRAYAPDCATSKTLRGAATALSQAHSTIAALRAERDEAIGKAERQWAGWVKEEVRRKEVEAQAQRLTEEKEALRRKLDIHETALSFVHRWAVQKEGNGTSAEERLSAIAHHPAILTQENAE